MVKLVGELPQEIFKWIRTRDISDFVNKAISELGIGETNPGLLGSGAYSSAWDIGDDRVLKIGLKEQLPLYMERIYGQLSPLQHIEGPTTNYRRRNSPELLEAGIYPRARTIDSRSVDSYHEQDARLKGAIDWDNLAIPEEDLRMLKVLKATEADRKGKPGSLLARSYASQDLHPYNLGISPEGAVVSIDSGAGIVEVPSPLTLREGYPRRAYFTGPDMLERWAEGYLSPSQSSMDPTMEAVLRRLSEWDVKHEL